MGLGRGMVDESDIYDLLIKIESYHCSTKGSYSEYIYSSKNEGIYEEVKN